MFIISLCSHRWLKSAADLLSVSVDLPFWRISHNWDCMFLYVIHHWGHISHYFFPSFSCVVDAWTLAFSPDSQYLATGTHVGKVNIFGVESGKKEYSLDTRGKFILSIAYVRKHGSLLPLLLCLFSQPVVCPGVHSVLGLSGSCCLAGVVCQPASSACSCKSACLLGMT